MTHDMWHVVRGRGRTFSHNSSSLALTVWERQCLLDWEEMNEWLTRWIDDKGVCRTAPATPGLWNIYFIMELKCPISALQPCPGDGNQLIKISWDIGWGRSLRCDHCSAFHCTAVYCTLYLTALQCTAPPLMYRMTFTPLQCIDDHCHIDLKASNEQLSILHCYLFCIIIFY